MQEVTADLIIDVATDLDVPVRKVRVGTGEDDYDSNVQFIVGTQGDIDYEAHTAQEAIRYLSKCHLRDHHMSGEDALGIVELADETNVPAVMDPAGTQHRCAVNFSRSNMDSTVYHVSNTVGDALLTLAQNF